MLLCVYSQRTRWCEDPEEAVCDSGWDSQAQGHPDPWPWFMRRMLCMLGFVASSALLDIKKSSHVSDNRSPACSSTPPMKDFLSRFAFSIKSLWTKKKHCGSPSIIFAGKHIFCTCLIWKVEQIPTAPLLHWFRITSPVVFAICFQYWVMSTRWQQSSYESDQIPNVG